MDQLYKSRMESLLQEEMDAYIASLETPLYQGLRISGRKQDREITKRELGFLKEPSRFADNTWYIQGQYGLHPAHIQGLYYLQEPSAGSAVSALNVQPDDVVLDLCAAPGSKSTQILDRLEGGYLVSNEIDPKRAQVLLGNMERMGAENFMVTNSDPAALAKELEGCFDKILVDAPCSGEGMMKKHSAAVEGWSYPNVLLCAARQKDILKEAWKMLRPGGEMVYSTCTYAPEENEANIAWALEQLPDARQLPIEGEWGRPGKETEGMDASLVRRIFPMDGGEGHFIARLQKGEKEMDKPGCKRPLKSSAKLPEAAMKFLHEQSDQGFVYYDVQSDGKTQKVFGMNSPFWKIKKGKVLRQGVYLGEVVKNRFEPAHAFFLSKTTAHHGRTKTETTLEQMDAFYHGEQLPLQAPAGYRALSYQGIPYGFGKSSAGRITNKLPKGLRLGMTSHIHTDERDKN